MELFNAWMVSNLVLGVVAVVVCASMNDRIRSAFSLANTAGFAGAAMGLVSVSAVAGLFV